jgi:hypothetical protein
MCKMFGCTPSQLEKEDASILQLFAIIGMGTPDGNGEGTLQGIHGGGMADYEGR